MVENMIDFYKNLPPKECITCGKPIIEQHECYGTTCDHCNETKFDFK